MNLTIKNIFPYIVFKAVSGSTVQNLNTENSDIDFKGVFILPKHLYYRPDINITQVGDGDEVYYELDKFVELLSVNNPGAMEMLYTPEKHILYQAEYFGFDTTKILSKRFVKALRGLAKSQLRKAKGAKKKAFNPVDKIRKTPIDFCRVVYRQGSVTAKAYCEHFKLDQKEIGLVAIPNMPNYYGLYYGLEKGKYRGIQVEDSNDVRVSSVEKDSAPFTTLYFNKEGYSSYCKDYKEYWDWVENRNEERYNKSEKYDAKNMMHMLRALHIAMGVTYTGEYNVEVRSELRQMLLRVKSGVEPLKNIEKRVDTIEYLLKDYEPILPEESDKEYIFNRAVQIREQHYKEINQ